MIISSVYRQRPHITESIQCLLLTLALSKDLKLLPVYAVNINKLAFEHYTWLLGMCVHVISPRQKPVLRLFPPDQLYSPYSLNYFELNTGIYTLINKKGPGIIARTLQRIIYKLLANSHGIERPVNEHEGHRQ